MFKPTTAAGDTQFLFSALTRQPLQLALARPKATLRGIWLNRSATDRWLRTGSTEPPNPIDLRFIRASQTRLIKCVGFSSHLGAFPKRDERKWLPLFVFAVEPASGPAQTVKRSIEADRPPFHHEPRRASEGASTMLCSERAMSITSRQKARQGRKRKTGTQPTEGLQRVTAAKFVASLFASE